MQLYAHYPDFQLVLQDKAPVIEKAAAIWNKECYLAVSRGKVSFMVHDFFKKNPVVGAEIYWLRHILYVWRIVRNLRRILTYLFALLGTIGRMQTQCIF